jgi:hypothetical protein
MCRRHSSGRRLLAGLRYYQRVLAEFAALVRSEHMRERRFLVEGDQMDQSLWQLVHDFHLIVGSARSAGQQGQAERECHRLDGHRRFLPVQSILIF